MSETHDPWKDVEAELARCREIAAEWGVSPDSVQLSLTPDSLVRLLAARAAEATQHQQEIAAKDAIIKQQAADLKVGGEMQDRETALKNALRELTAIVRGECPSLLNEDSGGNGELSYEIDTLLASPLSAPPQEPTGASPQAEELRAANVANLREMVGMAGRHRETLLAVAALHLLAFIGSPAPVSPVEPEPPYRETPAGDRIFRHTCGTPEDDGECMACGQIDCPDREPLHYHHDGCPCCSQKPTVEPEPCVWRDIDSAPKDGTEILVGSASLGPVVVKWKEGRSTMRDTDWMVSWDGDYLASEPYGWMPIPAPLKVER